ncbi:MAG TPA: dTDP-4-dehydrorhamnose 3,5-epimerase [Candidatus Paceibacterota bacterium]|nr:dTDP-4-dehydrorhamnose 3,5-epimerase [Candidatus Paceibacterota bacterium]
MKIEKTPLRDVYVITPDVHEDARGFFMETYRQDLFKKAGITDVFVQDNHSRSTQKNVVRGLHFQWEPQMSKCMRVTKGSAFLVAVDLRKGSPTLGKWFGIEASEDNKKQLYAPASFARGFQTLTDVCDVQYKCSAFYNPETQGEIAWDDKHINVDWPIKDIPLVSERNKKLPSFNDWLDRPESHIFQY